jgi:DNA-directed RNA polymerase subunit omega
MLYPSIDELALKVDGKYTLVVATFLRARDLRDGKQSKMMALKSKKEVGIALEEIYGDQILVKRFNQ